MPQIVARSSSVRGPLLPTSAQRPRAKLPGGSGQLSPTLRHAGGPGKQPRTRRPPGQLQRVDYMKALHLPLH